jgi:hypothetical protein
MISKGFLLSFFLLVSYSSLFAQNFKDASSYLAYIQQSTKELPQEIITFTEEVELGLMNSRTLDAHRKVILQKIKAFSVTIPKMPEYKSDKGLRDSLFCYYKRLQIIFEQEYPKVIRWQDSASKAFPAVTKWRGAKQLAVQELVNNELNFYEDIKAFSTAYGVGLSKKSKEEYERLLAVNKVGKVHDLFYTIYFTCKSQEAFLAKAIDYRKKTEMEQHSRLLMKYVKEGFTKLDTVKMTNEIKSMVASTKDLLDFYQNECEYKVPMLITFMARGGEDKKKGRVDIGNNIKVNPHVNVEDQGAVATYANTKGDLDQERPIQLENWNKASQSFLKKQLPEL